MRQSHFFKAQNLWYATPDGEMLLHPLSIALEEKQILAITGPNGAGKTTLMNLLCGALHSKSTDVSLNGKKLNDLSAMERAQMIAVVRQQETPDGRLSLRDYVALGQIPIKHPSSPEERRAELDRIMTLTSISDKADNPMAVLSGGERQRAHLARAMAQKPLCLFLDEPTNHLDPDAKGQMLSLITSLGITVVMVIHDLVMIPEFATYVAMIKSAQLVDFGPVDQVMTPAKVHETFGVDYLHFQSEGRTVPALNIKKTDIPVI